MTLSKKLTFFGKNRIKKYGENIDVLPYVG